MGAWFVFLLGWIVLFASGSLGFDPVNTALVGLLIVVVGLIAIFCADVNKWWHHG